MSIITIIIANEISNPIKKLAASATPVTSGGSKPYGSSEVG